MTRPLRTAGGAAVALVALALCVVAAGCAGGNAATSTPASKPQLPHRRAFPTFRIALDNGLDSLDPGLSYTTEGWGVLWNVYLPLLGYRHVSGTAGATLIPYLARSLPRISPDGRTYSLVLRRGLRYSNGRPVRASDFRFAIERDYQLGSPGSSFFDGIVGATDFANNPDGHIRGIVTDDRTGSIVVHLTRPQADFSYVLATIFAAPVPPTTPLKDQSQTPIPSTGPYQIQSYAPSRRIVETRNPHFSTRRLAGAVPPGNPDTVVWDLVASDLDAYQRVVRNEDDWLGYHPIPPAKLDAARRNHGRRLRIFTPANTYYFFMNTRVAPFDDVRVRRAVNYALDRNRLVGIFGGLATPTENILPPGDLGYRPHTLYPYDPEKAKRLVARSGKAGAAVTVWSDDLAPDAKAAQYLVGVLNDLGFRASRHVVTSTAYLATLAGRKTRAQVGIADWYQDFPHPLDSFGTLLRGDAIGTPANQDYAAFDDKGVDSRIAALERQPHLTAKVAAGWAALDRRVMELAPWAPFLNRRQTDFFSTRVDLSCYVNHVVYEFDYGTICIKQ
ncbi:MAG: ABC transporter substrate-binding protein [Actinobacteria bacterium]|nr:ABC transporter substrate-binding protein [Actinomycetota bacterium]